MAMVGVDDSSVRQTRPDSRPKSVDLVWGSEAIGGVLHSSDELDALLQLLCHDDSLIWFDDSTIDSALSIIITIIIIYCYYY